MAVTDPQKANLLANTIKNNFIENNRMQDNYDQDDEVVTSAVNTFLSSPPSTQIEPVMPDEIINFIKNTSSKKAPVAQKIDCHPLSSILSLPLLCKTIEATIVILTPFDHDPISIVSVYIPPNSDEYTFTIDIENLIQTSSNCVLFGDFNAPHTAWNCNTNSSRGVRLLDFTNLANLYIAYPDTQRDSDLIQLIL
ncbi:hypothetical protein TNCV_1776791 [Trichonephila clavipes]|nr:hypothetical protein TNCV_1776791 [Trichonephila clavipes]